MECVFCKIAKGEIPSLKYYEDEQVMVFLDINPDCNGHSLIIPKLHSKDAFDIDNKMMIHIHETSKKVMTNLQEKLKCDGFSLIQNNGSAQQVKHYHLHVKPVYKNNTTLKDPNEIFNLIK
ncbi:MAG: HIT domain-containing protein [Bacilli bacterium]